MTETEGGLAGKGASLSNKYEVFKELSGHVPPNLDLRESGDTQEL